SEHFSEYCPYFIHHGEAVIQRFGIPLDEYLRRCESIIASWQDTERRMLEDDKPVEIGKSVEYGAQIINAMESGESEVVYGNVPNRHLITNLPVGCCVEVPCLVDRQGLQPTVVGDLPPQLAGFIRTNVNVQELVVEAALTGKREHIYHAVMLDPHTSSQLTLDQMWSMCDELIDAHQRDGFLGEFEPTRKGTGRTASTIDRVIGHFEASGGDQAHRTELVFVVENQTTESFQGKVRFEFDREAFSLQGPGWRMVAVEPGKKVRIPLTFVRKKDGVHLRVEAVHGREVFLATGFDQPERQRVVVGSGSKAAPIRVEWSGNMVAEGKMSVGGGKLTLELRVNDSDIRTVADYFWDGSVLELFFAPLAKGSITQIAALPVGRRGKVFYAHDREPVPGAQFTCRADKAGYDAVVSVPLEAAGVSATKPFLFELQVRVNALGDAHGRVGQAWQGSTQPHVESIRYAVIEPV
ncbi:MAG: alpha-glucosidase/alpha-galactosidase, partial [Verrucomicrobiia bacterium]